MTKVCLVPHPSSCMLFNHGPSQQSSKEEYKPWKWGATTRYKASHTKIMLPMRKSWPLCKCKEMQTAVVWSCLPFIRSGQTILQGTVKGGRRQGRQRKRWEDNIRKWTGLELTKSQRAVENREKWRKLVAKSSVVSQQPLWLRDRWWWWLSTFLTHKISRISKFPHSQTYTLKVKTVWV